MTGNQIKEIMHEGKNFIVSEKATIGKIRNLFAKTNMEDVLVTNEKNKCLGIVSINSIFNNPNDDVEARKLVKKVSMLRENANILTAATKMVNNNVSILPIVNKFEKLEGIIDDFKIAEYLIDNIDLDEIQLDQIIEETDTQLTDSDNLGKILSIYRKQGKISEIPIIQEDKLLGSVSINAVCRDWTQQPVSWLADKKRDVKNLIAAAEVSEEAVTLYLENNPTIIDAYDLMKKTGSRTLFILENGIFKGLVSLRGIIHLVSDIKEADAAKIAIHVLHAPDNGVREHSLTKAQKILKKYENMGNEVEINISFKKIEYQSKRGMFSWKCQVRFTFGKSSVFNAESTQFGSNKALNSALDRIDRILRDEQTQKDRSKQESTRHINPEQ